MVSFVVILVATLLCTLSSAAADRQWVKTFSVVNPDYRMKVQPSWLEWMRIKRKPLTPGWGIAVDPLHKSVYVADLRAGKLWSIADTESPSIAEVASRHVRELMLDTSKKILYGEEVPENGQFKAWAHVIGEIEKGGALSTSSPMNDVRPGWNIAINGGRNGQAQALFHYHLNGRLFPIAGGQRGHFDGKGKDAGFLWIQGKTIGFDDSLYVTDGGCIRRITRLGMVSTLGGIPLGLVPRPQRSRLLGLAVSPRHGVFVADYDFGRVWQIPWEGDPPATGKPKPRWHTGRFWSPTGIACTDSDVYVLEHRPDSWLGRLFSWIGPWSRVRKVDFEQENPRVIAEFGRKPVLRRSKHQAAPKDASLDRPGRDKMRDGFGRNPGPPLEVEEAMAESPDPQEPVDPVDEASEESFPASDPPSWEPLHSGPPGEHPEEPER